MTQHICRNCQNAEYRPRLNKQDAHCLVFNCLAAEARRDAEKCGPEGSEYVAKA